MWDSYDPLNPQAYYQSLLAGGKRPDQMPLKPEEEDSLLSRIGGNVLGGLGWVGSMLDKYTGGRAARGLIGGKPHELLSILPYSDQLGITRAEDRVSGEDLATQFGWMEKGEQGWLPTAKSIAAEILTAPITYASFGSGALTAAGKEAAKAGALPKTTMGRIRGWQSVDEMGHRAAQNLQNMGIDPASVVGKPLGGLVSFGLPFAEPLSALTFGAGPGGEAVLNALGGVGNAVMRGRFSPVAPFTPLLEKGADVMGRQLNRMFDKDVRNAITTQGQAAGREMTGGINESLETMRGRLAQHIVAAQEAGVLDKPDLIRRMGELKVAPTVMTPQEQAAYNLAVAMRGELTDLDMAGSVLGKSRYELQDDLIDYLPRYRNSALTRTDVGDDALGGNSLLQTAYADLQGRKDYLKNVPGGTETLNKMSLDPDISGIRGRYGPAGSDRMGQAPTVAAEREELVRSRYFNWTQQDEVAARQAAQKLSAGQALNPSEEALLAQVNQTKELTRFMENLDPAYLKEQAALYGNHVLDDFMTAAKAKIQRNEGLKAVLNLFGKNAAADTAAGPGWIPLKEALQKMGFDKLDDAGNIALIKGDKLGLDLNAAYIPKEIAQDASRFLVGYNTPEALKDVVGAWDSMTNLTKTFQTATWGAFHTRNFISGMWSNFVIGANDTRFAGPTAWLKPYTDAHKLIRGGVIEDAHLLPIFKGQNLTPQEATQKLAQMAFQYRASSGGHYVDMLGAADQAEELRKLVPGMTPFGAKPIGDVGMTGALADAVGYGAKKMWVDPFKFTSKESMNPLNVAGFMGQKRDVFAPAVAGREMGEYVENMNRLSGFIGKMRQGYSPDVAAMQVRAAQVDYSQLSDFERSVMRRVIPFYSYTRRIIPHTLEELTKRPGGLIGTTGMVTADLRSNDEARFLPEYLGSGLAMRIGEEQPNGTQRFLTRLDTPAESAFDLIRPTVRGTGESILGMVNPMIKAPLELASGRQFYSGRDLADLYPMTNSTFWDEVLMNSPASRLLSTYRTVTDPRKWQDPYTLPMMFSTGWKISDVDMEKQRDIAARDFVFDTLRGQPNIKRFETVAPKADALMNLTPQETMLLRLNATVNKRMKERGEENKKNPDRQIGIIR